MLRKRVITALWLLPLALMCALMPTHGAFYPFWIMVQGLVALFLFLGGMEWVRIMRYSQSMTWVFGFVLGAGLLSLSIWEKKISPGWVWGLSGIFWLFALWLVLRYQRRPFQTLWQKGSVGIALLLLLPTYFSFLYLKQVGVQANLVLIALLVVWCADTGAYFVGRQWGKHALLSQVSPKKTREGLLGGLIVVWSVAILGYLWQRPYPMMPFLNWMAWITGIAVASIVGDLFESLVKRIQGVKDSGRCLPGHGGILDRIDSLTAALPIAAMGYWIMSSN